MILTDPTGRDPGDAPPPPSRPKDLEELGQRLDELARSIAWLLRACACSPKVCGGTIEGASKASRSPLGRRESAAYVKALGEAQKNAKDQLDDLGDPDCSSQGKKCSCELNSKPSKKPKCSPPKRQSQDGGGGIWTLTCKFTFSGVCKLGSG